MAGIPGSSGPPKGNKNALKNGTKTDRRRLTIGELPTKMISVKREARAYRRDLEAAVLDRHDEIDVMAAHYIDTAAAATMQAGVCRWTLRHRLDKMTDRDVRDCVAQIVKAKQARDTAVKALELDAKPEPIDLKQYLLIEGDDECEGDDE